MIADYQKIVLGTVQFGLDYGVSNKSGKTSFEEAERIISSVINHGIFLFDTAPDYGDSEKILEKVLHENSIGKVITKIPAIKNGNVDEVIETIHKSISLFKSKIWGVLFHNPDDLLKSESLPLIDEVQRLYINGNISRIGGSIYSEEQINVLDDIFNLDILQLPFNIFDQRFKGLEIIKKLRNKGCEIHVRSVFLQGLLLMDSSDLPSYFMKIKRIHQNLGVIAKANNISVYDLCLKWVMQQDWVDRIVLGVNDNNQVGYLIDNLGDINNIDKLDLSELSILDTDVINPARWP